MIREGGVRVKVPASTANLGPGFDTLGMALSLYSWIEMKPAETTVFHLYGDEMGGLPKDKSNLVYQVAQTVFAEAGVELPELDISMYSEIPLTRGLGSSASAIVGALFAANLLIGSPLDRAKLFDMATAMEKHPDNVGASLFGGIITAVWDGSHADVLRIEPPADLEVLVAIPDFQLSTSKAREALPREVSLQDAVYNVSRTSLLTAALAAGRLDLIPAAMRDRLHQPYRAQLVPGMARILAEATEHGALGAALSGAGPTLLALADRRQRTGQNLEVFLLDVLAGHGIRARTIWLEPCTFGAMELTMDKEGSFMDYIKGEVRT
ncbi:MULTISPECIES: homoserine kinase [Paenibacillus]|uniref:Homoserine kinase n=1 Tax=Paenibacillus macerans TaxID=44252 RepID=A0A090ZKG4_PAEMA|nr:homoserine kinase [Paenibacillus macerans]KFN11077.1 homoserine kinase [Paenibacillus macerans]MBS5914056.1 homoserine kinase [Paenibacillus macerans]MCY7562708.1 homoserine kinase [Paenibacillus macerans]MEC0151244.1 homoserine kinase [Paenibacillus macerans]SUD26636.1 homoserine kinase [Paenibacillus macerans]